MQSFRISHRAPQDWEFSSMIRTPSLECASDVLNLSANHVHNTGSDYYFENIPDGNSTTLPNDSTADRFIDQDHGTSTQTLLTVPLIGWTPKRRLANHPYDCGFPK